MACHEFFDIEDELTFVMSHPCMIDSLDTSRGMPKGADMDLGRGSVG